MENRHARSGGVGFAPAPEEILRTAIEKHRAGRLVEAAALYEDLLAADATNVAALHLLGVVRSQQGLHARAAELLARAVTLRPEAAPIQASLAETALALGRYQQAAFSARAALRCGPDDPMIRFILGRALLELQQREEAVDEFRRAVALCPDFARAHNQLGNALRSLGRLDEARAAYEEALRLAPDLAPAYANLGLVYILEDRLDEAHRLVAKAAKLEPGQPSYWKCLADLYERMGQFDAAVPCLERVLALTVEDRAPAHIALGHALHDLNRREEAEAHFRIAVTTAPELPGGHLNLGVIDQERGQFVEAEAAFRRAIQLNPLFELAHVRLATLLGGNLPDADLDALRARIDDPRTVPEQRSRLNFALGQVLDARGDYPGAAAALRAANAQHLALSPSHRRFTPERLERNVTRLLDAFNADFFARNAGAGLATKRPVFIIGLPRSGTTLLEQVLASHPRVVGGGELMLGPRSFEAIPDLLNRTEKPILCVPHLEPASIRRLAQDHLDQLQALTGDAGDRVIDKLPGNYLYLGMLVALFPNATIIHCRRDLRDTALSCWMADFRSVDWADEPTHIAAAFRGYLRLMDHWRAVLPTTLHEVDYEETVSDLESVARRLLTALELDWDPACLEFHRMRRPVRTGSLNQVRQPLYQRSVARWKHYENELADLFAALPPTPTAP